MCPFNTYAWETKFVIWQNTYAIPVDNNKFQVRILQNKM